MIAQTTDNLYAEKRWGRGRSKGINAWRRFLNRNRPGIRTGMHIEA